ncbi:pentapeptide repeat-containing protein [Pseudonocardia saturnea]
MARARRARPAKLLPDPPDTPSRWDPAPAVAEDEAVWDGVEAGPDVEVPPHVAGLDLRECRWTGADLSGRELTGFRARDTRFEHCDLSGAVLDDAVLRRVTFTDCRLTGASFAGARLDDVRITDSSADLTGFRMAEGTFLLVENTSLHAADFYSFSASGCAFLGCDLREASFHEARMAGTRLHGSQLDDVRGAMSLAGARISPEQLVPVGAALLGVLGIQVTEPGDVER